MLTRFALRLLPRQDGVKDGVSNIWRNISPGEPKAAYAQLESAVVPLCAQSTNPKALCDWMREMGVFYITPALRLCGAHWHAVVLIGLAQPAPCARLCSQVKNLFMRRQVEVVAGKTAEGLNCDF